MSQRQQVAAIVIPTAKEIGAREAVRSRIADITVQIPELEGSLAAHEASLPLYADSADAQIRTLQSSLLSLRHERTLLKTWLYSYTYPVLTLPNEIVAHIFLHFLPVYPRCPPMTGRLSPTTLGHICHEWRSLSLSIPALWRAISISLDGSINPEPQLRLLESWLERSGSYPLSIRLQENDFSRFEVDLHEPNSMAQAIFSHWARWHHVQIDIPLWHCRDFGKAHAPLLRSMAIQQRASEPSDWTAITFIEAPRLQKLALAMYADVFANIVPWAQLTTLRVASISGHELMYLLRRTVNLVHCKCGILDATMDHRSPIQHLHLKTLVLSYSYWTTENASSVLFDALILPALRKLQLPEEYLGEDPTGTLRALVSRSGCSLQALHITDTNLSSAVYRTAFPFVPSVSSGNFTSQDFYSDRIFGSEWSDVVFEMDNESDD
ncbi:hypothetical protein FB451DRAFT_277293 [Mycena latifolia]|nr:hypothetical protein FB451DRAFT_277293 [Mycena latifolia]